MCIFPSGETHHQKVNETLQVKSVDFSWKFCALEK